MKNDLPAEGCGVDRIEQDVGNDLDNFSSKANYVPLCFNALTNNYPLPLGLGTIKVRYLAEQLCQLESGRLVVVAVKLEHLGSNASETFYLVFQCGNVSLCLGTGLQWGQQVYEVGNRA